MSVGILAQTNTIRRDCWPTSRVDWRRSGGSVSWEDGVHGKTESVLAKKETKGTTSHEIIVKRTSWAEIQYVAQEELSAASWLYTVFV